MKAKRLAHLIMKQAPKLQELSMRYYQDDEFSDMVLSLVKEDYRYITSVR